jgi:SAM-dependent methyltransferase
MWITLTGKPLIVITRYHCLTRVARNTDSRVMTTEPEISGESWTLRDRVADGICRRAFSSPEALAYEIMIAPALARSVLPTIRSGFSGGRILDVGCGGGRIAASLRSSNPRGIVGLDPSAAQVRAFARRSADDPTSWAVRAEAGALPFADDSFDYVFSSCAWKHWSDSAAGVAECCRVVRKGGTILIDGASSTTTFSRFARLTRFPPGLRWAYLAFAMRTVVGVAPDSAALAHSFLGLAVDPPQIARVGESPFLAALTTAL